MEQRLMMIGYRPFVITVDDGSGKVKPAFTVGERRDGSVWKLPAVIYRGLWRWSDPYAIGDVVTHESKLYLAASLPTREHWVGVEWIPLDWNAEEARGYAG